MSNQAICVAVTVKEYKHPEKAIILKRIYSPDDLKFMTNLELRARINSHREYKIYNFKSDSFDELSESFEESAKGFTKFLKSLNTKPELL